MTKLFTAISSLISGFLSIAGEFLVWLIQLAIVMFLIGILALFAAVFCYGIFYVSGIPFVVWYFLCFVLLFLTLGDEIWPSISKITHGGNAPYTSTPLSDKYVNEIYEAKAMAKKREKQANQARTDGQPQPQDPETLKGEYVIEYKDAEGFITTRGFTVQQCYYSERGNDLKVRGTCHLRNASRTLFVSRMLKVTDTLTGEVATGSDIPALLKHLYETATPTSTTATTRRKAPAQETGNRENLLLEVCFTGFSASDKKELIAAAEQAGVIVRKAVTSRLSLLVCGSNAGPKKMEQAQQHLIPLVIGKKSFYEFLETGEIERP